MSAPLAALTLLVVAAAPALGDLAARWADAEGHYGHGPLVVAASAWLAWRARGRLAATAGGSHALGPAVLLLAAATIVVGRLEDVAALVNGALVVGLFGLALTFLGAGAARVLAFPIGFLLFAVPAPPAVIDAFTFHLKVVATWLTVAVLDAARLPVVVEGSALHFPGATVTVADACSGLKTATSLTAMAALFAHLQPSRLRAALIAGLALPIAVLANAARVLFLSGLVAWWGPEVLEGPLHDGSGLVVYAVAMAALLALHAPATDPAPDAAAAEGRRPLRELVASLTPGRAVVTLGPLALAAVASVTLSAALALAPPRDPGDLATARMPLSAGAWRGELLPLGGDVLRVLGTRDARMQRHTRPGLPGAVDLYVTHSGGDVFRVAHPPARCFEGGGYLEVQRDVVPLSLGPGLDDARVNRLLFQRGDERVLVYTWYRVDGRDVPSYVDYRLASFLRRLGPYRSAGSMVRLSTVVEADALEAADERVRAFAAEALAPMLAPLDPLTRGENHVEERVRE